MRVRRKMIGGEVRYEIAEAFQRLGKTEYHSVVPLGGDADPEEALRKRQASLIDITRALMRLQPLQDADPAIRRKCETLKSRLKSEQERIGLLMSCIERLDDGDDDDQFDGQGG